MELIKMKILEHNVETGEVIERDLTADELAQYKKDEATEKAKKANIESAATQKAALLERLGLTPDEAALLVQ
jgi:hypothetical protein